MVTSLKSTNFLVAHDGRLDLYKSLLKLKHYSRRLSTDLRVAINVINKHDENQVLDGWNEMRRKKWKFMMETGKLPRISNNEALRTGVIE